MAYEILSTSCRSLYASPDDWDAYNDYYNDIYIIYRYRIVIYYIGLLYNDIYIIIIVIIISYYLSRILVFILQNSRRKRRAFFGSQRSAGRPRSRLVGSKGTKAGGTGRGVLSFGSCNKFSINPLTPRRTLVSPFTKISILF